MEEREIDPKSGEDVRQAVQAFYDLHPYPPPTGDLHLPRFEGDDWLDYTPLRLSETTSVRQRLPAGAAAGLLNRSHSDPDLVLFVDSAELRLVEAIDGRRTIAGIIEHVATSKPAIRPTHKQAHRLFQRLWQYDQVVFDITPQGDNIKP